MDVLAISLLNQVLNGPGQEQRTLNRAVQILIYSEESDNARTAARKLPEAREDDIDPLLPWHSG